MPPLGPALLAAFLAAVPPGPIQSFSLEQLTTGEAHDRHVAPPAVQRAMRALARKPFADCARDLALERRDQETYFSSLPLPLGRGASYLLVYPSRLCDAFRGAHAIAFWIVRQAPSGAVALLHSDQADGLDVLAHRTHGLRDVRSSGGPVWVVFRFDGRSYRRAAKGEYPE